MNTRAQVDGVPTTQADDPAPPGDGAAGRDDRPEVVIEACTPWPVVLKELWAQRELLYIFTWRDVKVRYKQTAVGVVWVVLQPALMMVIFTFTFGRLLGFRSGPIPYPIFVYAGLLPWLLFSTAVASAANSVVASEHLVTKIYFPRLAIPLASVGASLLDFFVAFGFLLVLMVYYRDRVELTWAVALVPLGVMVVLVAAVGVGTLLAALNVVYRDVRYAVPFLLQAWLFATPAIYMDVSPRPPPAPSAEARPAGEQGAAAEGGAPEDSLFFNLNPMNGPIRFLRAATLGGPLPWRSLGISAALIAVLFVVGCWYFRRTEDRFADII
jgi:lipopolysaccharide transport system permease protein